MFELFPMNLEMDVERRREVIAASMRAARKDRPAAQQAPAIGSVKRIVLALVAAIS